MGVNEVGDSLKRAVWSGVSDRGLPWTHKCLGSQKVGIHEAGKEHPAEKPERKVVGLFQKWRQGRQQSFKNF